MGCSPHARDADPRFGASSSAEPTRVARHARGAVVLPGMALDQVTATRRDTPAPTTASHRRHLPGGTHRCPGIARQTAQVTGPTSIAIARPAHAVPASGDVAYLGRITRVAASGYHCHTASGEQEQSDSKPQYWEETCDRKT
jgi:hypothetical protein